MSIKEIDYTVVKVNMFESFVPDTEIGKILF